MVDPIERESCLVCVCVHMYWFIHPFDHPQCITLEVSLPPPAKTGTERLALCACGQHGEDGEMLMICWETVMETVDPAVGRSTVESALPPSMVVIVSDSHAWLPLSVISVFMPLF